MPAHVGDEPEKAENVSLSLTTQGRRGSPTGPDGLPRGSKYPVAARADPEASCAPRLAALPEDVALSSPPHLR